MIIILSDYGFEIKPKCYSSNRFLFLARVFPFSKKRQICLCRQQMTLFELYMTKTALQSGAKIAQLGAEMAPMFYFDPSMEPNWPHLQEAKGAIGAKMAPIKLQC